MAAHLARGHGFPDGLSSRAAHRPAVLDARHPEELPPHLSTAALPLLAVTWNLRIGRPLPGEKPNETAERLAREEQEEAAPDPAEIRRMGDLLARAAPSLAKTTVPKGWALTHAGSGAHLRMSGDEFSMTVPRVFSPSMGRAVWTDLWPAIQALSQEGYAVYASPLGRVLDPETDFNAVVSEYAGAAATGAQPPQQASKPWWKFW